MKDDLRKYASDNQLLLATLYRFVTFIGFTCIAAGFVLYVSGVLPAHIPVDEVSSYWHLSAQEYAGQTGTPYGWDLIKAIAAGDMISLASLVLMAIAVIVCLIIMVFAFLKSENRIFAVGTVLQIVVLALAASGIVSGH